MKPLRALRLALAIASGIAIVESMSAAPATDSLSTTHHFVSHNCRYQIADTTAWEEQFGVELPNKLGMEVVMALSLVDDPSFGGIALTVGPAQGMLLLDDDAADRFIQGMSKKMDSLLLRRWTTLDGVRALEVVGTAEVSGTRAYMWVIVTTVNDKLYNLMATRIGEDPRSNAMLVDGMKGFTFIRRPDARTMQNDLERAKGIDSRSRAEKLGELTADVLIYAGIGGTAIWLTTRSQRKRRKQREEAKANDADQV